MSRNGRESRRDHYERENDIVNNLERSEGSGVEKDGPGQAIRDRDMERSKYSNENIRERSRSRNRLIKNGRNDGFDIRGRDQREKQYYNNHNDKGPRDKKDQDLDDNKKRVKKGNNKLVDDNMGIQTDGDELMMAQMMGFTGFATTKGKQVQGTDVSGAYKPEAGSFRQYMNRSKGFNRPLSPPPGERRRSQTRK